MRKSPTRPQRGAALPEYSILIVCVLTLAVVTLHVTRRTAIGSTLCYINNAFIQGTQGDTRDYWVATRPDTGWLYDYSAGICYAPSNMWPDAPGIELFNGTRF